jgi:peptide/nickel transport system permease protein
MRYLLRRIGFYLVALWAAVTVNFVIPRLMPGNPILAYLGKIQAEHVNPEQIKALGQLFNVNPTVPVWQQYFDYLGSILRGQLGLSLSNSLTPVSTIMAQGIPWTLYLVGMSIVISFIVGTLIGIFIAWRRGSWYDTAIPPILIFAQAAPYFWVALGLVYVFALRSSWFPIQGGYDIFSFKTGPVFSLGFFGSVLYYSILPIFTLVLGSLAQWVLLMRNTMVTTLGEDYILMARAKGLPDRRTMFNYAARNSILPSITSFSISVGLVFSGALLTEIVFNYPGIGTYLFNGVLQEDYPLIEACFLFVAVAVLVANFLSELLYAVLDPRVRQGRS